MSSLNNVSPLPNLVATLFQKMKYHEIAAIVCGKYMDGTIDKNELVAIYDALIPLAQITVSVDTDKGNLANAVNIPVSIGKRGTYQGVIPAYGTTIESITLQIKNLPTLINLYSISARNMSFSQLRKDGRIKIFDEN